jgi:hypothetical protein
MPGERHAHHRLSIHKRRRRWASSGLRRLARIPRAACANFKVSAQPDGRGQCRCSSQAADNGAGSGGGDNKGKIGSWTLGTDFLWRIRWATPKARARENYWGMTTLRRRPKSAAQMIFPKPDYFFLFALGNLPKRQDFRPVNVISFGDFTTSKEVVSFNTRFAAPSQPLTGNSFCSTWSRNSLQNCFNAGIQSNEHKFRRNG